MVYSCLKRVQMAFYPPRCILCGAKGLGDQDLCMGCYADFLKIDNPCLQCGLPVAGIVPLTCGQCQKKTPHYDQVIGEYIYAKPFSSLLVGLKFNDKLNNARLLADLMYASIQQHSCTLPEMIIPVPLHAKRTRERGFNQALELSRILAKQLAIDLNYTTCHRVRITQAQSALNAKQRRSNVKGAFELMSPLQVKHIAIVDDVMTTGSTVNELAKVLKAAGVERVDVWVAARAL